MSIIALPATLRLGAGGGMGQARFDLLSQSDSSGSQQVRVLAPPRWTLRLVQPEHMAQAEGSAWLALCLQLRGRVNLLAAWDPARPAPAGTLRGNLTLASAAAVGAVAVSVTGGAGQAGNTVVQGDWLQIGSGLGTSQLVMCTGAATADAAGLVAIAFEPPLRAAFATATAVTWDKPLAYYRQQTDAATWTVANGGRAGPLFTGLSMDLMESWS